MRARTLHLCSEAAGPSTFAAIRNSSGDYAGRCKTTPSWCGGGGIEYGHFSPCSTEEHTQQKAACNKELITTTTTNHHHYHRSTTTTTGTSKVVEVLVVVVILFFLAITRFGPLSDNLT